MKIVPVESIPKSEDYPLDNPVAAYKLAVELSLLCQEEDGVGLSAVQVGFPWKLFVANVEGVFDCYVNCKYEPVGEEKVDSLEGCLSLKRDGLFRRFLVQRYKKIRVQGKKLVIVRNKPCFADLDFEIEGLMANVFQHEIDHQVPTLVSEIGRELEIA